MKYSISLLLLGLLAACGSNSNKEQPSAKEAPAAIENSTQHPNGVTGGAVISRDTGAMLSDSPRVRRDSMPDKK